MTVSTLTFEAHEALIISNIERQAGSVGKAILEGTMNGIEACNKVDLSPQVWISFESNGAEVGEPGAVLRIKDLGCGITTKQQILDWWKTFGTPHEDSEKKIWANFRMGRGQMFTYGRNIWRTGTFRLEYDHNTPPAERNYPSDSRIQFGLEEGLDPFEGCEIEIHFYKNPVGTGGSYASVEALKADVKQQIEFIEGEIYFNDEQINTPASLCKWDDETEDAYFLWGIGTELTVYNIGAYVCGYAISRIGVSGVVVSKKQLRLNYPRNAVMQDACPVWVSIRDIVDSKKIRKIRASSRRLEYDEKVANLIDLRDGKCMLKDLNSVGLLETSSGKSMSLPACKTIRSPWTFAPKGDMVADKLVQAGDAICLSDKVLREMNYTGDPAGFFEYLLQEEIRKAQSCWNNDTDSNRVLKGWKHLRKLYRPFQSGCDNDLCNQYDRSHLIIPSDKLSKFERRVIRVLAAYNCWHGRTIVIGLSDCYHGWTDGDSYIAINRKYLKGNSPTNYYGAAAIITLMFHELAHDEDNTETDVHGFEFYKAYHDLTRGSSCWMIADLYEKLKAAKVEDYDQEQQAKAVQAKEKRDKKLRVAAALTNGKKKVAVDGITVRKVVNKKVVKKKRAKYRRF